jgi:hypothetical protein
MSGAVAGPGWLLKHAGTLIEEVLDISGPEQKAEKDDVTNQSSPNFYKEWIPTLLDGGDVSFTCNLIPGSSSQIGLLTAMQARTLEAFTLTPPSPYGGNSYAWNAYVVDWDIKTPHSKKATFNVKLAVTGPVSVS